MSGYAIANPTYALYGFDCYLSTIPLWFALVPNLQVGNQIRQALACLISGSGAWERAKAVARPVMDLQAGRGIFPVRNVLTGYG